MTSQHRILATPDVRVEGRTKVTGAALFAADFPHLGVLEVAYFRSPIAHASIRAVDASAALRMPGVHTILTGTDVAGHRIGRRLQDWPVLADDRVRMIGDRIAAVAADTLEQARAAAARIDFDYEELNPVFDIDEALESDAPILHPLSETYRFLGGERPNRAHGNIQGERSITHGAVDSGFAAAFRVFDHTFEMPKSLAGPLEPRTSMAWIEDERIRVISTNKSPFRLRDEMAVSLDLDPEEIVIINGYIGGDFGAKGLSIDEHVLALMTRAAGRPVRLVSSWADDASTSNCRHGGRIRLRTAVDADGQFLAHEAWVTLDGGAYAAAKPNADLLPAKASTTLGGYRVPAARVHARSVYTNTVPGGNARSPGQPQTSFAAESHVDMIARDMGIDPLELRQRNVLRDGDIDVTGHRWEHSMLPVVLEKLRAELAHRPAAAGLGRGIALTTRGSASGSATVRIRITADATIEILTGVPDQGAGAYTMLQRVVAEALDIDVESVFVHGGSTDDAPYDRGVGGSRVTPIVGGAALVGARRVKARLEELSPGMTTDDQIALAASQGGFEFDAEFNHPSGAHTSGAIAVDLAVDRQTGAITLSDIVLIADIGGVVNPVAVQGQLLGGIANGIGTALMEELVVEQGNVTNPNMSDYKMPTVCDVPDVHLIIVSDDPGAGPFGAKSVGELSNSPVAPAVANAVEHLTGVRVLSLPITAEKVLNGISGSSREVGVVGSGA